ncbi:MAG: hypothetical protein ACI88H_002051 [Cocleimonas sp.]
MTLDLNRERLFYTESNTHYLYLKINKYKRQISP